MLDISDYKKIVTEHLYIFPVLLLGNLFWYVTMMSNIFNSIKRN